MAKRTNNKLNTQNQMTLFRFYFFTENMCENFVDFKATNSSWNQTLIRLDFWVSNIKPNSKFLCFYLSQFDVQSYLIATKE